MSTTVPSTTYTSFLLCTRRTCSLFVHLKILKEEVVSTTSCNKLKSLQTLMLILVSKFNPNSSQVPHMYLCVICFVLFLRCVFQATTTMGMMIMGLTLGPCFMNV